ncbi:MAG: GtrA family protein [Candidatus Moranbacteria bacterium GW2011_GWF2_36_839]|nr:MAG: GtrA family protein [Candidatus Moranbacteria bacterium GW2011_GWF1_36_78]KKQ17694.1 MAG: GtrA family protein [Candidatus Moranbacteria bacterium GW2011_GWF2_36_839]HAT73396.1 hypothetical protein [Candidatus Moranbacteria bacterium]HBY10759.1 hypothetical protein [Candidatus Moranbacteria bacterium]
MQIEDIKNFLKKKPEKTFHQFLRYLVAGGTATLVDLSVLFALYQFLHINHLVAAAVSYCCGILTNFTINVLFVFESSGRIKKEFIIFASVGAIGLLWTEFILWSLSDKLGLPVMLAKIIAVIFVLFWNFFMRKKLVFRK